MDNNAYWYLSIPKLTVVEIFDMIDVDLGDVNSRKIRNMHKEKTSKDLGDLGTGIWSR